ncbi:NADPH-dependent diflavin oxidoreductase 1 [Trichinella pseudospiralis]|uniref:NADPH-dependent diflavin oxidoreductase 1 n=1 Tax=Trichinella pseudospiralis TaxID=6337 RepID=A0A0V1IW17_TRIPS|nr:NADPH-dependent diflavin oxidoreductase 1 [Trichinella pseudospiralis]KRZ26937.1 NADPH-dependent diflavin oxidoreductase 1 [Trichinella pseudospiralis]
MPTDEEDQVRLSILYGSQTGNAEDVAVWIWRQAVLRRGVDLHLGTMDDYDLSASAKLKQTVLFVCSTTGQGDPPDNMKKFWRSLLNRHLSADFLNSWTVAVLGLGDSKYGNFNYAARKLHARLLQLGAGALLDVGLADDQHPLGYESVVSVWKKNFWTEFHQLHPEVPQPSEAETSLQNRFNIAWQDHCVIGEISEKFQLDEQSQLVQAEVVENRRITAEDHFQDVRLISFELKPPVGYLPGDVLCVRPANLDETVQLFHDTVQLENLDRPFYLQPAFPSTPISETLQRIPVLTFRHLISNVFDLQAVPGCNFFKLFSLFAANELQREKLQSFASPDGIDDLYNYCNRPRRTVAEVLSEFPETARNVPLQYWFDLLGEIKPRAFSICSSAELDQQVQIVVAVVRYRTRISTDRLGLCSNWLSRLQAGHRLSVTIKHGSLVFPSADRPVILIGPGTGVAALRSFLRYRLARKICSNVLFFGCRHRLKDYLFEKEFETMAKSGHICLYTAFSRDQREKIYVQHRLRQQAPTIYKLLTEKDAIVYICGNANSMPAQVIETLKQILVEEGSMSAEKADDYLKKMVTNKQLQQEVWS